MLEKMLENAKKDKKAFNTLKTLAVKLQMFEFASQLREMEIEVFPLTEEEKKAKKIGQQLTSVFSILKLNTNPATAWKIYQAIHHYDKCKGEFSIDNGCDIAIRAERLFED